MENQLKIASNSTRFGHWILDLMCYSIFVTFVIFITANYLELVKTENFEEKLFMAFCAKSVGVWLFGRILYYIISEGIFGTTIGKIIAGTEIVTTDGKKPTKKRLIKRTFARFIPFDIFSFLSGSGIGWHDYISGTRVVIKKLKNI